MNKDTPSFSNIILDKGPIAGLLQMMARAYISRPTLAGIHSGFASQVVQLIDHDQLPPLKALVRASEDRKKQPLTNKEKTILYINTFIGGLLELATRATLKIKWTQQHEVKIRRVANRVYNMADWPNGGITIEGVQPEEIVATLTKPNPMALDLPPKVTRRIHDIIWPYTGVQSSEDFQQKLLQLRGSEEYQALPIRLRQIVEDILLDDYYGY